LSLKKKLKKLFRGAKIYFFNNPKQILINILSLAFTGFLIYYLLIGFTVTQFDYDAVINADSDCVPSPENLFVVTPFEENIPLVVLINAIYTFKILEILLVLVLLGVLFKKYIYKFNINYPTKLMNRFKYMIRFEKYIKLSKEYNNKFAIIMFIIISAVFILFKFTNLYFSAELNNNINDYVLIYNHYKNIDKGCMLFFIRWIPNISSLAKNLWLGRGLIIPTCKTYSSLLLFHLARQRGILKKKRKSMRAFRKKKTQL